NPPHVLLQMRPPPRSTLFPYTTPSDLDDDDVQAPSGEEDTGPDTRKRFATREREDGASRDPFILNRFEKILAMAEMVNVDHGKEDRKSTRLNSSHLVISYAVFCLKKKK